jgi:hypothetical protein
VTDYFVGKNGATLSLVMDHDRYKYRPKTRWDLCFDGEFTLNDERHHTFPSSKHIEKLALEHLGKNSGFELEENFSRERYRMTFFLLPGSTTIQRMTFLSAIIISTKITWNG